MLWICKDRVKDSLNSEKIWRISSDGLVLKLESRLKVTPLADFEARNLFEPGNEKERLDMIFYR